MAGRTRVLLAVVALGAAMAWGMLAQRNHWPPYPLAKALLGFVSPPPGGGTMRPDPALVEPLDRETDPRTLLHAADLDALDALRGEMTAFLFGEDRLPTALPRLVAEGEDHPDYGPDVRRWNVDLEFGIRSVVLEFGNPDPRAPVVLYHQGHVEPPARSSGFLLELAAAGARVFSLAMPFHGRNPPAVVDLPQGPVELSHHGHLDWIQPTAGHALRFMVEPVVVVLNELEARRVRVPVTMIGLSGGGWTTTLAAALDPRIGLSIPVAGTLPMWLRFGRRADWGDWEQHLPDFYRRFSYLDLYAMAAAQPGRLQLQVLNQYDPCCFAGARSELYEPVVQQWLDANGAGEFRVLVDDTHAKHAISPATQAVLKDLIPGLGGS